MKLLTLHLYPLMAFTSLLGTVAIPAHSQPIIPAADGTGTTVNQNGNQINIQGGTPSSNGSNLFHSFSQFNVESGQTANFLTTPDIRNILGRVTGGNASTINGLIQVVGGNSNLFLMNPAGILFGPNASLNVPASFSVTTATGIGFNGNNFWFKAMGTNNYSNLVGNPSGYHFDVSNPGAIVNEGNLSLNPGNNLTLAGGTVVNTGELSTAGGNITIAAVNGGDTLRISQAGHVLSLDVSPASANLSGESITPLSLAQLLTGGETSHASSVIVDAQGNLVLTGTEGVAVASGNIDVSTTSTLSNGGQGGAGIGGQINVLGDRVAVIDANIEANGVNGGGTVLIGGDVQGNGNVPNSQQTFVNNNSLISADAINNGNGGQVIIWSDGTTNFAGNISAKGGEFSGDGGFVEISGKEELIFDGNVNVGAALGESGTILFDPKNIIIGAEISNENEEDNQTFSAEEIEGLEGEIILQADNDITVNQAIETSESIELNAGRSININADIDTSSGNSNITLLGNDDGADINNRDLGAASINQTEGTTLNAGSGNITIRLGDLGENGDINLANLTTTGQVLINANRGNISRVSPNSLITADRAILTTEAIGGVGLSEAPLRIDVNNLEVFTGEKGLFIDSISNLIIGGISEEVEGISTFDGGDLEISINGNLTVTEQIITSTPDSEPGNITISSTGNIDTTQITINANSESTSGGDLSLNADGDIKTGEINVSTGGENRGGNVTINSGGEVDTTANEIFSGSISGDGGSVTITSNGNLKTGDIDSRSDGSGSGGDITLESTGGSVDTSSGGLASYSVGGDAGNVSITSQGDIKTADIFSSAGDPLDVDGDLEDFTSNTDSAQNGSGSGGDITLRAEGTIDTSAGTIESFSRLSAGGIVSITTKGDITTGRVFSTAGEPTEGDSVTTEITQGEINSSNSGDITIESTEGTVTTTAEIDTAAVGGNAGSVTIKAFGDIKTESIESSTFGGDGGDVTIESTSGSIDTTGVAGDAGILSTSIEGTAGNVIAKSNGNLIAGNIDSNSENGRGGNITLESTVGNIDSSLGALSSFSNTGDAGDVNIKSLGDIKTGRINSVTTGGTGGDITLESTGGNIDSSGGELASSSLNGNAGDISLTSEGNITTGNISSFAGQDFGQAEESENSGSGDGGDITLKAGGTIDTTAGTEDESSLESFSRDGSGGNIILEAQGDITTGTILSTAGNPENDSDTSETTQTEVNGGSSGDISITSTEGTVTTTAEINSFATNGDGGSVTIESFGDINIGNNETEEGADINSRSDSNGQGGDIRIESTQGAVTINGQIESFAAAGQGGSITIKSHGDIEIVNNQIDNADNETPDFNSRANSISDGGDISIESNTGAITINRDLSSSSETGNGGDINIKSFGDLITSDVDSRSDGSGQGGSIILESTSGNVDTSGGNIFSFSESGNAGGVNITSSGNLTTAEIDSRSNGSGQGGSIILESTGGNVNTSGGSIFSFSESGNAGGVNITSSGNLTTGEIDSRSKGSGQGGSIILESTGGNVNTSNGVLRSFSELGDAGDVNITSNLDLRTAQIDSRSNGSGQGGSITLESTDGNINTSNGELRSSSLNGNAGNVSLTSQGNITTGNISSFAGQDFGETEDEDSENSVSGDGGDITLIAGGTIDTTAATEDESNLESFSRDGSGGNISLEAQGNITTGRILSTAGDPDTADTAATTQTQIDGARSGDISIKSTEGTVTTTEVINSFATTGDGGSVTIESLGDINIGNEINSRSDRDGTGGDITIESQTSDITINSELSSSSQTGNGGNIKITAGRNIDTSGGELGSFSGQEIDETGNREILAGENQGGKGGDITLEAEGEIKAGRIESFSREGSGGSIRLEANGNITTSEIISSAADPEDIPPAGENTETSTITQSQVEEETGNPGGNITIKSTEGTVTTQGEITSYSNKGAGGNIEISGQGDINILNNETDDEPGVLDSRTASTNGSNGGEISITSETGKITIENELSSSSQTGKGGPIKITARDNITSEKISSYSDGNGDGGEINITSTQGNLEIGEILSSSGEPIAQRASNQGQTDNSNSGENTTGVGGKITLNANEGSITVGDIESFSRQGSGGSIRLEAKDDITTGEIISSAADPEDIAPPGENTETSTITQSQVEEETGNPGGNITIKSTEGTVTTQGEITSYSNKGAGGNIEISGQGDINIRNNETDDEPGVLDSRTASTNGSNGGEISITSETGKITIENELSSSSQTGKGGPIKITAPGNITSEAISSYSEVNGDGGEIEITSTQGDLEITEILSSSGEPLDRRSENEEQTDNSNPGGGGDISLNANEGKITVGDIESFSRQGSAGDININAKGNIITDAIISSAGDPEDIPEPGRNSDDATITQSQVEEQNNRPGGNINIQSAEGTVTTQGQIISYSDKGDGGDISIVSNGELNIISNSDAETNAANIDSRSDGTGGNGGEISIESQTGIINATGQLASSSETGDGGNVKITATGNINTETISSFSEGNGQGGSITIKSTSGSVDTRSGELGSFSSSGDAGDIKIEALEDIKTGRINSLTEVGQGQGGDIRIESTNGSVNTVGTEENTGIFSSSVQGDAGDINITSNGNLTTGDLDSRSERNGEGGNITLKSTSGDVDTTGGVLASYSGGGNAGNIDISSKGDLITGEIFSSSGDPVDSNNDIPSLPGVTEEETNDSNSGENSGGQAGNITLKAEGKIDAGTIESFSREGTGGSITIETKGNVIASEIISSAANPEDRPSLEENSQTQTITQSQVEVQTERQSGNIKIVSTEGTVTTQGEIISYSNEGNAGNIEIIGNSDINLAGVDSRADNTGSGGEIVIESQTGIINTINGQLASSSRTGNGGNVNIIGAGNIEVQNIFSFSEGDGNGGDVTITSDGDIRTGTIGSYANRGQGGNVSIFADGAIDTSIGEVNSFSLQGEGGNVTLNATSNITTGFVESYSGGGTRGGNITLETTNGNIDTTVGPLDISLELLGFPLDAEANISTDADVSSEEVATIFAQKRANLNSYAPEGTGGNITIIQRGQGNVTTSNISSFGAEDSGSVNIINNDGNINTGVIFSTAINGAGGQISVETTNNGDLNINHIATYSSGETGTGGDINLDASGTIDINNVASFGDGGSGDVSIQSRSGSLNTGTIQTRAPNGTSGNITLNTFSTQGDIQTANVTTQGETAAGTVEIIATDGSVTTQDLESSSESGSAGGIDVQAGEDIETGDQTVESATGDASISNVAEGDITTGDQTATTEVGDAIVTNTAGGDINTGDITATTEVGDATVTNTADGDINTGDITATTEVGDATVTNTAGGDINTGDITATTGVGDATVTNTAGGDINTGDITATTGAGDATVINTAGGDINTGDITAVGDTTNIINQPGGEINTGEIIEINPSPSTLTDNTLLQLLPQTPIPPITPPNVVPAPVAPVTPPNVVPAPVAPVTQPNVVPAPVAPVTQPNVVPAPVAPVTQPNVVPAPLTITPITENISPSNNLVLNPLTTQIIESVQSNSTITTSNNPNLPSQLSDILEGNLNTDTTTALRNINILNSAPLAVAANSTTLTQIEQNRNEEFADYFELELSSQTASTKNIREVLIDITRKTGNNSAIIYVNAYPDEIQLVLYTPDSEPILKTIPKVNRKELMKAVLRFRAHITNPARRLTDSYLPSAQQLYDWLIAPISAELEAANIDTLLFSMDEGLRALPVAALHDGEQFLIEKYSLSLIPSVSLMDTNYRSLQDTRVLAMGASNFRELNPLPAVPVELETISQKLWEGSKFINEEFTRNNLLSERESYPYPIIHLATHAEFKPGKANNSYIQLWGSEQVKLDEIRELGWDEPAVELLVLSACRTAVGDKNAELGFAGLAVAAGVKSALASIWYVSDEGTLGLMTEFYVHLNNAKIKAEALRQAQLAMLRGEVVITEGELRGPGIRGGVVLPQALGKFENQNLSHPYYWSGFTMVGSPW